MSNVTVTKEQWVEVLDAAGVDEAGRQRWHKVFEKRYPEGHQAFLQWLRLPADEIERIRDWSKG